ncbi:MAG TPA: bS21 family ribosomal protein [Anaerolineae bacterium]|nr:bS21 family ribosomal protein [Anaerolineae bacterium]
MHPGVPAGQDRFDGTRGLERRCKGSGGAELGCLQVRGRNSGEGQDIVTRVVLRHGESFNSMLKRFRKAVTRGRVLSDVKKKRYHVSKGEKRHRALRKAIVRERKRQRKVRRRIRRGW